MINKIFLLLFLAFVTIFLNMASVSALKKVEIINYNNLKPTSITSTCYSIMGYKWSKLPIKYTINPIPINPANPSNLSESFIISAISASAEEWDSKIAKNLFDSPSINYNVKYGIRDNKNAIVFADLPSGEISKTTLWVNGKKIAEFDIIFNTWYLWGDGNNPPTEGGYILPVMDLQSMATHEFGHAIGLGDVFDASCSGVTMYGYSDPLETQKRTLEQPDITGLSSIYP